MGGVYRHRSHTPHVARRRYVPSLTAAVAATSLAIRSRAATHYQAQVAALRWHPTRSVALYRRRRSSVVVYALVEAVAPPAPPVVVVTPSVGRGLGVVAMEPSVYRATLDGQLLDDVSAFVTNGRVVCNVDAETKLRFTCELLAGSGIADWDVLAPYLTLRYDDGTVVSEALGRYVVVPPPKRHTPAATFGRIDGRDLTWVLQRNVYAYGTSNAAGQDYGMLMREVVENGGFPAGRVSIPDAGVDTPDVLAWPPGTSRYEKLASLAKGVGWYVPWMDREGMITTRPMRELDQQTPTRAYSSVADAAEIVGEIDDEPDLTRLCNVVTVRKLDPSQPALKAVRKNENPASPSSTWALGEKFGSVHPVTGDPYFVLARVVDEPTIATQAEADALADAYLAQGGSFFRKLTLRTLPDATADVHDTVILDITNDDGIVASGLFWRTGWSIALHPTDGGGIMLHSLSRVEPYR